MAEEHLNTEKPDIELRRRLDKIEALGLLLGNQEWGAPLEGKYYDKLGHTIADLAMEAKEIVTVQATSATSRSMGNRDGAS